MKGHSIVIGMQLILQGLAAFGGRPPFRARLKVCLNWKTYLSISPMSGWAHYVAVNIQITVSAVLQECEAGSLSLLPQ